MADIRAAATLVTQHIEALKRAHPDLVGDAELLASAIEGETDFFRVFDLVVDAYGEARSMQDAAMLRSGEIRDRANRFGAKADAMRKLAHALMDSAGEQIVRLPAATVSIRPGVPSVVVEDVAALPQGFTKTEVVPRREEIRKALVAGEAVPGAYLETGPATLAIRVK